MAQYSPQPAVSVQSVEDLRQWIEGELESLSQAFNELNKIIELNPTYVEPTRIKEGMLIYADGANFNPGAGRGTYERRSGAWVKL